METAEMRREIVGAAGECLMQWAAVEWNICILYTECVVPREGKLHNPGPHTLVFDSVISLDARMDMVTAIIRWRESTPGHEFLSKDCSEKWKKLRDRIKKSYKKRNEVAHSSIVQSVDNDNISVCLAPFATMSSMSPTAKRLSLADLQDREKSFRVLAMEINAFRAANCNHKV